jgi:integrase
MALAASTSSTDSIYENKDLSPYQRFIYALRAPESKRQYPRRLQIFLGYLKIQGLTIEEKADKFYLMVEEKGRNWLEHKLLKFFRMQNQRAERNEISTETIKNYLKPVKLFCEMNGVIINCKIISKGILRGSRHSNDRPPTKEEISKLLEYPDRRMKPIVLIMVSSGIRVGSWNYLKCGDIPPITKKETIVAAKIKAYNTKTNRYYFSFITLEAYQALKEWLDFRQSFGEKITPESWIMRNLWQIKSQRYGNYLGLAKHPTKFSVDGIRMLINDAWKIQGVREKIGDEDKYPFKSLHGFRKFFETECQKVVKSINVSILMSHDTGITQHYYKPKEEELLADYLKASDLLTINSDSLILNNQINDLDEKNRENEYIIKGKLQEKDEQIKSLSEQFSSMKIMLESLIKGISIIDESEKQLIAKQLIENGVFK